MLHYTDLARWSVGLGFVELIAGFGDVEVSDFTRGPSHFHQLEEIRIYVDALLREREELTSLDGQIPTLRGRRGDGLSRERTR